MCGIAGIFSTSSFSIRRKSYEAVLAKGIARRGPDGNGAWTSSEGSVLLVHSRLAIQDLSSDASQPMRSHSGRYYIVFNGEIYNHRELRDRLDRVWVTEWQTSSDSETLLRCIETLGLEKTLELLQGMWAFAVYDIYSNEIVICNDRNSEKPLYWGRTEYCGEHYFFFSSSLNSFKDLDFIGGLTVNTTALDDYFAVGYVPAPLSIYNDIYKLESGSILRVCDKLLSTKQYGVKRWFTHRSDMLKKRACQRDSFRAKTETLHKRIVDIVDLQMSTSDVPICVFLSGGIDSSLIASIAQQRSDSPVRTYSVAFEDKDYDETDRAVSIAKYLGTDHKVLLITMKDFTRLTELATSICCEPLADPSLLATMFLCESVRADGFKVALSGDGADEFYAGYSRYRKAAIHFRMFRLLHCAYLILAPVVKSLIRMRHGAPASGRRSGWVNGFVHKLWNRARYCTSYLDYYKSFMEMRHISSALLTQGCTATLRTKGSLVNDRTDNRSHLREMLANDQGSLLPGYILTKSDTASMNFGVETRAPFLDRYVTSISDRFTDRELQTRVLGKLPLRQILKSYLPDRLVYRGKKGFDIPLSAYLEETAMKTISLRLDSAYLARYPYLNEKYTRELVGLRASRPAECSALLWRLLFFFLWSERNL